MLFSILSAQTRADALTRAKLFSKVGWIIGTKVQLDMEVIVRTEEVFGTEVIISMEVVMAVMMWVLIATARQ